MTWVLGNLLPGIAIKDPAAAVYELAAWATGFVSTRSLNWAATAVPGIARTAGRHSAAMRSRISTARQGRWAALARAKRNLIEN